MYSWNIRFLRHSPFAKGNRTDAEILRLAKSIQRKYQQGVTVPFSYVSSLKSMGRIPRSDGTYTLGDKYRKLQ